MARYHAIIPAAGAGRRFGTGGLPKQYWPLDGKSLLEHSIERLADTLALHALYVAIAVNDSAFDRAIGARRGVTALRCGGQTRAQTVRNALQCLTDVAGDDWIVVHDAVRPCIDRDSLLRLIREIGDDPIGGLLAVPVISTLKRADGDGRSVRTEPRDGLWQAQTPQMFRYRVLCEALNQPGIDHATDEAQAVETLGYRPRLVSGTRTNVKITYPDDLQLAAAIMAREPRGAADEAA